MNDLVTFIEVYQSLSSRHTKHPSIAISTSSFSLSQNCWDTLVSPCRLNVSVQGLVTEPR